MRAKVTKIISDLTIEIDEPWIFHGIKGNRVKLAGLIPSDKKVFEKSKKRLSLLLNQTITLDDFLYVSGNSLFASTSVNGEPIQKVFPERAMPILEPSRWTEVEEREPMRKVWGGIPVIWQNPITMLSPKESPFLENIKYPVKPWEKDFEQQKQLADALFVDSHINHAELDRTFKSLLNTPPREAPLIIVGDVGVGKSWWISHKLMHLPSDKYHPMVLDLRYTLRGNELQKSLANEIDEYLSYYITNLKWLYQDFKSVYGDKFDPNDPQIINAMRQEALNLTDVYERIRKKLRYYARSDSPELVVAFDNLDHFSQEELASALDMCRRIIGHSSGVKAIVMIRPTTNLPKDRTGLFFGDATSPRVVLRSPNVYSLLERRLSTNIEGEKLDLNKKIRGIDTTWREVFNVYRNSDNVWGLANFIRELCCSEVLFPDQDGSFSSGKTSPGDVVVDIRHYLKLFRRMIRSNALSDLSNVGNLYYGIQALMLSGKDPMIETDAYLFNLFDNEKPVQRGNALIRYRVLEYCQIFNDLGETFNIYFRALGYSVDTARRITNLFADAGLIKITYVEDSPGTKIPAYAELTIAGRRHLDIVNNLWYIICIKTGMNIFPDLILWGDEAKEKASEFVKSETILDYYAEHGWVSEDTFVKFLGIQELMEYKRIGQFQESHPEWREQVANWVELISSPAANVYWSCQLQLEYWRRHQRKLKIPKPKKK